MSNTVIAIRSSGVASNTPSLGVLANGEIALNYADGIIYYKTDSNTLGQIKTTEPSGLDTEIQFNDSGSFGSNAGLTFDKTTGTLSTLDIDALNVISEAVISNSYIQFGDGTRQYTANAGDAGLTDDYARDHANGAFATANNNATNITTAQNTADGAYTHANGAFDAANTTATNLSTAEGRLDFAYTHANSAYDQANTATTDASTAQTTADAAFGQANTATTDASTAQTHAEGAFTAANTAQSTADGAQSHAEGAFSTANTNATNITTAQNTADGAFTHANAAYTQANTATTDASTAQTHADAAFDQANTNATNITTAQNTADGAFTAANNAQTHADAAYTQANTATSDAADAQTHADAAFDQANTNATNITTAQNTADGAYAHANGAFDEANTKFDSAGGTISGFVDVTQNVTVGSYVDLNTAPSNPTHSEGRLFYDNTQKSLAYYNEDSEMTLQIGQETVIRVYNESGATINNASLVRISGSNGDFPSVVLADATSTANAEVIGMTTTEIANAEFGYVTSDGKVGGVDTSLLSAGVELFLSETPGEYTTTVPATPSVPQTIGYVASVGASGSIVMNMHQMIGKNMTDGSIIFAENGGLDQDNADLYWDNINKRLGINTNTPSANLHVVGTGLFTGNVEILGNLIVTNAEAITTTTLNVGGNTIVLSDEVSGEPTVNAEIVINRGTSDNVSIRWDETTDEWILIEGSGVEGHILSDAKTFQSWTDYSTAEAYEKAGYPIGATLANATHQQAVTANNLAALAQTVGQGAYNHANGAFTQANTAQSTADGAQTHAEGAFTKANTNATNITTAQNTADGAFSLANGTAIVANTDVTNISAPAGSYGNATFVPVITLASNGRVSTISTQELTGGGGTVTFNITPPASGNTVGDIWIDSNTGIEFTWVEDEDSAQWVEFSAVGLQVEPTAQLAYAHANGAFDKANTALVSADIGSTVQAYDVDLTAIGALAKTDGNFIVGNGSTWVVENGATARTSLGLGSLATLSTVDASTITDNSVGAAELNVSGNGTTSQYLRSDGDGTFTWATPPDTNTTYSAGTGVTLAGTTFSIGQAVGTGNDVQFDSFGVGTAASGTTGEIRATNNITAYYSDKRLKENIEVITDALEKVKRISGVTFNSNDEAAKYGYKNKDTQVGVIAQEIEEVLPQIVVPAPFDIGQNEDGSEYSISGENYKTVQYEKITPLLIQAIKELTARIEVLESK